MWMGKRRIFFWRLRDKERMILLFPPSPSSISCLWFRVVSTLHDRTFCQEVCSSLCSDRGRRIIFFGQPPVLSIQGSSSFVSLFFFFPSSNHTIFGYFTLRGVYSEGRPNNNVFSKCVQVFAISILPPNSLHLLIFHSPPVPKPLSSSSSHWRQRRRRRRSDSHTHSSHAPSLPPPKRGEEPTAIVVVCPNSQGPLLLLLLRCRSARTQHIL